MSTPQPLGGASVKYSQQYRRCGRPNCPTCTPPGRGHGPYWYAYWWEDGRVRSRYLGKQQPSAAPALQAMPQPATAGMLRVRTLGSFAVWRGGDLVAPSHWSKRKMAALFKCLLSAPGYQLHREQVIDALFPDAGPSESAGSLRSMVYRLRKVLDQPGAAVSHLHSRGDLLVLLPTVAGVPEADWLDALAFDQAAAEAMERRDAPRCRKALSLYGGDYLPDDRYEAWAERRREELRARHLAVLLHLAELSVAAGEVEEALVCLRTVLAEDQYHETAAQELMKLLAADGRRIEALEVYRKLALALDTDIGQAPAPETQAVHARLLAEVPVTVFPPARRNNLPAPLTSFVGRAWERSEVTRLLVERPGGCRLVTLVGAGGCGKTRLALEVARGLLDDTTGGVFLVELAAVVDAELLAEAVADVLGLRQQVQRRGDRTAMDVLSSFLEHKRLLLVLDNCEHLLAACAQLATVLLRRAPKLRILATSQVTLGLLGEIIWRVTSLALPEGDRLSVGDLAAFEAIQLFLERAQAAKPRFGLTARNATAVLQICRQLDGIPLAIELAAARLSVLSAEQIAARLDDRLQLLSEGNRTALPRQQTLRATIDWCYNLLNTGERLLLQRISVFAGGWTLESAESVCTGGALARHAIFDGLSGLAHKSLVQVEETEGAARYRLLETVRLYGLECLVAAGEHEATRDRHLAWFLALAEQAEPELKGKHQGDWLARLEQEHDNLCAALRWARQAERRASGLRLAGALQWFWNMRGRWQEGRVWLECMLETSDELDAPSRARALQGASTLAYLQTNGAAALTLAERNLELCRETRDDAGIAFSLHMFGMVARDQGKLQQAVRHYEEALILYRRVQDCSGTATGLQNMGTAYYDLGNYNQATRCYEEALTLRRQIEDQYGVAALLSSLGALHLLRGRLHEAGTLFEECLDVFKTLDTGKLHVAAMTHNLGVVALERGRLEEARKMLEQGLELSRELGNRSLSAEALFELSRVARLVGDPDRAAELLRECLQAAQDLGNAQLVASIAYERSTLARQRGDLDKALMSSETGLSGCDADTDWRAIVEGVESIAAVLVAQGRLAGATRLYGAAAAVRDRQGTPVLPSARATYDDDMTALRNGLGDMHALFWEAGRARTVQEAVTEAIEAARTA